MKFHKSEKDVTPVTESRVRELVDEIVRKAVREQARDVEKHLTSIHERLLALEIK